MTRTPSGVSVKHSTCTRSPSRPMATNRVSWYSLRSSTSNSAASNAKSAACSKESPRSRTLRSFLAGSKVMRTSQSVRTKSQGARQRLLVARRASSVRPNAAKNAAVNQDFCFQTLKLARTGRKLGGSWGHKGSWGQVLQGSWGQVLHSYFCCPFFYNPTHGRIVNIKFLSNLLHAAAREVT